MRLRAWLRTAELPDPPMITMPGIEAWSPELTRRQLLAETFSEGGPQRAILEPRYIAARYGPPEIRALARPDQLPGDPRGAVLTTQPPLAPWDQPGRFAKDRLIVYAPSGTPPRRSGP
jgi:hypothetical protein